LQPHNLADTLQSTQAAVSHQSDLTILLTVFILAVFVGYYVIWKVTPALHSPLMSVTNAISSIIVVGALIAVGLSEMDESGIIGTVAIILAAVNITGGFLVTQRMLGMFKGKTRKGEQS
jgi:NAD(P) transhydrogenase subunit alpha